MLGLISQRTNLKANHNYLNGFIRRIHVGPNIAKNKSESKSQQRGLVVRTARKLGLISQRTNLKANHNANAFNAVKSDVGPNIAKNKSESKSQPKRRG